MPHSEDRDERLEALSEALAQMVRRQRELEERVRVLESRNTPQAASEMRAGPAAEPESIAVPPPLPQGLLPPPVPQPPPTSGSLETTFGLNWINRIAVFTLLLGAAFLFKYGVDYDWFGPGVRVALGIAAAAISLIAGDRVWRRGQTIFAQGLVGLGLALLYLSIYAAATLYHLLPQGLAFGAMCVVTAGAAGLALLYNSQAIAVIAMLGGYITPPALSTGEDHPWILFGYVFLLNLGGLALARRRAWKALEPIAAGATFLLYAAWFSRWFGDGNRMVATVFAFAFYAQFSFAVFWTVCAVFQLGASIALGAIWREQCAFAWWNLSIAAGGLGSAYIRDWKSAPIWALVCYGLPFGIWCSPAASFAAISVAFLLFFAWELWRAQDRAGLGLVAANAAVYYAASYSLLNPAYHAYMGLLAAAVGAVHLLLARNFAPRSNARVLSLGIALAFATLAIPIQFVGFRVTIAWALEGSAIAWLSSRFRSDWLRAGSWAVFALALARLFALDVWTYARSSDYSIVLNTRFLTCAVSTAALWLAARFFARRVDAAVAYIAGHVVLLFGLSLEIGGWVSRNIVAEDQSSVQIIAISVMLTLYAVVLVLVGLQTRAAIHRMLGLALVIFVVAKLYLVDVWVLGRLFRITAFLALGVLLLILSYLYSRLRPALARLLRPFERID